MARLQIGMRTALAIPVAYASIFGLLRALHVPPGAVLVSGTVSGTAIAAIILRARSIRELAAALVGIGCGIFLGAVGVLNPRSGGVSEIIVAAFFGWVVCYRIRALTPRGTNQGGSALLPGVDRPGFRNPCCPDPPPLEIIEGVGDRTPSDPVPGRPGLEDSPPR